GLLSRAVRERPPHGERLSAPRIRRLADRPRRGGGGGTGAVARRQQYGDATGGGVSPAARPKRGDRPHHRRDGDGERAGGVVDSRSQRAPFRTLRVGELRRDSGRTARKRTV